MAAKARQPVDLEALARDYSTGAFSDRELGVRYGRSHTWVQNKIKELGLTKDLNSAVRHATAAKVAIAEVQRVNKHTARRIEQQVQAALPVTQEVVTALAEINSQVVIRHRSELRVAREEVMLLFAELRGTAVTREQADALSRVMSLIETNDSTGALVVDPTLLARAREAIAKNFSVAGRIDSAAKLVTALARLQERESTAYGLTDDDRNPKDERLSLPIRFVDVDPRKVSDG